MKSKKPASNDGTAIKTTNYTSTDSVQRKSIRIYGFILSLENSEISKQSVNKTKRKVEHRKALLRGYGFMVIGGVVKIGFKCRL